ncbi:MAG: tRNA lysidine(34) synthetase TilS [Deltaproteobacteria bacterium]|nr:tRNA lysidine(34) synthetase TilS [Deltaproteobacteria bacterium]
MRVDPFIQQVLKTARRHEMWRAGDIVLVALSGGRDSVALVRALGSIERLCGIRVVAGHVDHGLRDGSADDAKWVDALCAREGIPHQQSKLDAGAIMRSPLGIEAAAREARHAALETIADDLGATKIATAHHRDDQAETVLERLTRGAGTRGLRGILPVKGRWIRPFLEVDRERIANFAASKRLKWREDPTNADTNLARNALRHIVLPALREIRPGCDEVLARAAEIARREDAALDRVFRDVLASCARLESGIWVLCVEALLATDIERRRVFWHRFLWEIGSNRVDLDLADDLERLIFADHRQPGFPIGSDFFARRESFVITIAPARTAARGA